LLNKDDDAPLIAAGSGSGGGNLHGNGSMKNNRGRNGRNNAVLLRYEEKERQECATSLAERISLHFQEHITGDGGGVSDANGKIEHSDSSSSTIKKAISGCLPLVHGEIYNGLTSTVLCMLRPCAITLRLSVASLVANSGQPSPSLAINDNRNNTVSISDTEGSDSNANRSSTVSSVVLPHPPPAIKASLGQPLRVTMEVESNVDEATQVFCSFMCTPIPTPAVSTAPAGVSIVDNPGGGNGGGGDALETTSASTTNIISQGSIGIYSPSPAITIAGGSLGLGMGLTATMGAAAGAITSTTTATANANATWTGIHSRLHISVPAKGKITHIAGVAVVAPGWYRVGTGHVTVTYLPQNQQLAEGGGNGDDVGVSSKNTLVSVAPCFIDVE
jgi:hypothetical protein